MAKSGIERHWREEQMLDLLALDALTPCLTALAPHLRIISGFSRAEGFADFLFVTCSHCLAREKRVIRDTEKLEQVLGEIVDAHEHAQHDPDYYLALAAR